MADWIGVDVTTVPNPHPSEQPKGHRTKPIPADVAAKLYARIMRKVELDTDTGCLIRTAAVHPKTGYTACGVQINGKASYFLAHRVVWTHLRGPIPPRFTIDHLCKRPACVNVEHLEVVTQHENVLRSNNPAALNARRTECKNGHPLETAPSGRRWCPPCRRENDRKRLRKRKPFVYRPLTPDDRRHGTLNGYTNYRCRCEQCKGAARAYHLSKKRGAT